MRWVDQTKAYTDNKYNNKTSLWAPEWSADQGPEGKVFGFFYSTWGINFTLLGNALATPVSEGGKEEVGNGILVITQFVRDRKVIIGEVPGSVQQLEQIIFR